MEHLKNLKSSDIFPAGVSSIVIHKNMEEHEKDILNYTLPYYEYFSFDELSKHLKSLFKRRSKPKYIVFDVDPPEQPIPGLHYLLAVNKCLSAMTSRQALFKKCKLRIIYVQHVDNDKFIFDIPISTGKKSITKYAALPDGDCGNPMIQSIVEISPYNTLLVTMHRTLHRGEYIHAKLTWRDMCLDRLICLYKYRKGLKYEMQK